MTIATASLRGHRAPLFSLSLFSSVFVLFLLLLLLSSSPSIVLVRAQESSPPVSVAVAFDPSWVGTTGPEGGAYGVRQALSPDRTGSRTLDPALLTSADPQQWALLLASSQVLVVAAPGQGSNYAESAVAYFNGSSLVEVIRDWTAAGGLFVQAGRDAAVLGQLFFDFDYTQASAASSSPALATSAVPGTPYDATAAAAAGLPALAASWEVVGVPAQYCLYSTAAGDAAQPCSVVRQSYGSGRVIYLAWDFADAAPDGTQDGAAWVDLLHTAVLADAPSASLALSSPSPSPSPSAVASEVSPSPSPSPSAAGSEVSPSPSPSYAPTTLSASPSPTSSPLSPTPSPTLSASPTFYPTPSVALTPTPSPSFNSSSAPSPSVTPSVDSSPSPSPSHHDDDDDDDEEEDDGPPPFVMDMTWILAVIVLAIVVLALIAVGVKLYERFSRRSGYDEIPAADPQDHFYGEAEEQYAYRRV